MILTASNSLTYAAHINYRLRIDRFPVVSLFNNVLATNFSNEAKRILTENHCDHVILAYNSTIKSAQKSVLSQQETLRDLAMWLERSCYQTKLILYSDLAREQWLREWYLFGFNHFINTTEDDIIPCLKKECHCLQMISNYKTA